MAQQDPNTKLLADLKSLFMKDGVISPLEQAEYNAVMKTLKTLGKNASQEAVAEAVVAGLNRQKEAYLAAYEVAQQTFDTLKEAADNAPNDKEKQQKAAAAEKILNTRNAAEEKDDTEAQAQFTTVLSIIEKSGLKPTGRGR